MSELTHYDQELAALDRQIVRLGTLCGMDAANQATITAILDGSVTSAGMVSELRKPFLLLKGLLALRYHVEKHCVDDIGPGACQQILENTLLK